MSQPEGRTPAAGSTESPLDRIPWWRRLSVKLTVAIAVVIFATITGLTLLSLRAQEEFLVAEAVRGASLFGDSIRSSTHDQMLRGEKGQAYRAMESVGALEGIEKVRLFNKEGKITYSTDRKEAGSFVDKIAESCYACHAAGRPIARLSTANRARIYRSHDGHRVLGMVTPIHNEEPCSTAACHAHPASQSVLGVVDIGISLEEIDRRTARLALRTILLAAAAALVLASITAFSLRRLVLRPVRDMVAATRRIERGHLKEKVPVHALDELGFLSRSFNEMTVSLRDSRLSRHELLETLERQVEERTAALRSAQSQLVRSERLASLGQLSASIAHEIDEPLRRILDAVRRLARVLETGAPDEAARAECLRELEEIAHDSERGSAVVSNLLDFARERPLDLHPVEAHAALDEALAAAAVRIEALGITVRKELSPPAVVLADFARLRQSFVNVLLNACDAMPKGGTLTLSSRIFPEERRVELAVADTGAGIPAELLPRIFDPFVTTREGGSGLGLSVVLGIVERHGGTVTAESGPGPGATFRIRLPLLRPDGSGPTAAA